MPYRMTFAEALTRELEPSSDAWGTRRMGQDECMGQDELHGTGRQSWEREKGDMTDLHGTRA
eukprot:2614976-Heterocapsa_arctica.AAC.1